MTHRLVLALAALLAAPGCGGAARTGVDVDGDGSFVVPRMANRDEEYKRQLKQTTRDMVSKAIDKRLDDLLEDTFTDECRKKVAATFAEYSTKYVMEEYMPFERVNFQSQCPKDKGRMQLAPPKPADEIRLVYLVLVHQQPALVIRIIDSLQEPGHHFIIHVDGKAPAQPTYEALSEYALDHGNVHMMTEGRQNVSWGGFNVVQATLNGIELALEMGLVFDWLINLSGATYPLGSNRQIRQLLSQQSTDHNLMEIRPSPNVPADRTWHHFVECDNRMRRVGRLRNPRGISMYMGSQWFVISRDFAHYVVTDTTFVSKYKAYGVNTMVADENFFATVIKNSPFCHTHVNKNNVHVQFDQWEHDTDGRDPAKCLQPNPDHCGRSPTINTLEYLPVLELSEQLFARKFDPRHDAAVLDAIDYLRAKDTLSSGRDDGKFFRSVMIKLETKHWQRKHVCMEMGPNPTDHVRMQRCDPTNRNQLFEIGPCSSDGDVQIHKDQVMNLTTGQFSRPFCPIRSHNRRCLDLERERIQPNTQMISWQCTMKWNQLFSFGAGDEQPGSIYINIPYTYHQPKRLCLEAQDSKEGAQVRSEICYPDRETQKFVMEEI